MTSGAPDGRYRTVAEVASELRVDRRTVYRMIERGELDAVRLGRVWRVDARNGPIGNDGPEPSRADPPDGTDQEMIDVLELAVQRGARADLALRSFTHEVRSPVAALLGYTTMLVGDGGRPPPSEERQAELAARIRAVGRRIAAAIDAADVANGVVAGRSPVTLRAVVAERARLLPKGRRISPSGALSVAVHADVVDVVQAVDSLLYGAWAASTAGIDVEVRGDDTHGTVQVRVPVGDGDATPSKPAEPSVDGAKPATARWWFSVAERAARRAEGTFDLTIDDGALVAAASFVVALRSE